MDSENIVPPTKKQRRNTKKPSRPVILFFCILLIGCLLIFFYLKGKENVELASDKQTQVIANIVPLTPSTSYNQTTDSLSKPKVEPQTYVLEEKTIAVSQNIENSPPSNNTNSTSSAKDSAEAITGAPPEPPPIVKDSICDQSYDVVHKFLLHLDNQQYIKQYTNGIESEVYFIELIQKLGDNPPVVSRETDDLFTILKNTAHFFRIIGKDNILALKGILANEKDQFEIVLSHFYKMTQNENCLNEMLQLNLSKDVLYDYAGFFLNTMGGRLYLFRRDSVSRLTVSYFSILLIEQANREGRNTHGLDIRPAVELLIPEIENSGAQLRLKDIYLDKLYELEDRMN